MDDSAIAGWLDRSRRAFVAELVATGIAPDVADARARATEAEGFPDGRPAAGHRVFALVEGGQPVGHLWIALDPDVTDSWWVYDVEVDEQARGRGLGRRLMELAEVEVARLGGTSIGLSVFGTNSRARRLYESLGYEATSIRMRRRLE
jgi:ribosomal protein S18 acetylase RimI-like enzyme